MKNYIFIGIVLLFQLKAAHAQFPYPIYKNKTLMSDPIVSEKEQEKAKQEQLEELSAMLDAIKKDSNTENSNQIESIDTLLKKAEAIINNEINNKVAFEHTTTDSMIREYFNLIKKPYTAKLSATKALDYKIMIDSIILNSLNSVKVHIKSKNKPKKLNEEDSSFLQNDYLIEYYHQHKNLLHLARNYFNYISLSEDNPITRAWWLPLRTITHAEYLYFNTDNKHLKLLEQLNVQSDFITNITASSTLVSGILPFEFRSGKLRSDKIITQEEKYRRCAIPIKFEVGTTITQSLDSLSKELDKINNKLLYGGLIQTRLSYPIYHSNWKYFNGKGITVLWPISYTANMEQFNKQNSPNKDLLYFGELATNLYINLDIIQGPTVESDAHIYTNIKLAYVHGGNAFKNYTPHLNTGSVATLQMNAGLSIKNKFTIAVNWPIWASEESIISNHIPTIALILNP